MKKIFFIMVISVLVLSQVNAQTDIQKPVNPPVVQEVVAPVVNPNGPKATWDKVVNDFGEIEQGTPKEAEFKLTNDGKEPLVIQNARASCGCTNLKYSQEPILPGKSTIVAATYNAAAMGSFNKTISVTTSADAKTIVLTIKGTVVEKK